MKITGAFDGKQRSNSWSIAPLALLAAMAVYAAPVASAQDVDAVGSLTEGVRCSGPNAKEDLGFNIRKLAMSNEVIVAALNAISADSSRCSAIQDAAAELAKAYPTTPPATNAELPADVAIKKSARIIAEADKEARVLKFEVKPPPRNMTRGQEHTQTFGQ